MQQLGAGSFLGLVKMGVQGLNSAMSEGTISQAPHPASGETYQEFKKYHLKCNYCQHYRSVGLDVNNTLTQFNASKLVTVAQLDAQS